MIGVRLSSGDPRLDDILRGGLLANGINLITGVPGSGKTILAHQYLFHNATPERPAIYCTSVSEPLDKTLRYGQTLTFFDPAALGSSVFYEDLGQVVNEHGLDGVLDRIDELVRKRRPALLVIDSFKALHVYAADEREFRTFLHVLAARLSVLPLATFWVGEYATDDVDDPEFAVADAIISLNRERNDQRERRVLRIAKSRGSAYQTGGHAYRITPDGLRVYPRLADPQDDSNYALSAERSNSGVEVLDTLLGHGYWTGSSTIIAGPTGVGKTLVGLHFVFAGVQRHEPGIIATFQENPVQLARICHGFGWSLQDPSVLVMYNSPVDVLIDEWVYQLLDAVQRVGAHRVFIDSLGDLRAATGDDARFQEFMYSLLQRTTRLNISVIMTQETPELYEIPNLSGPGISHISDNVIVLHYYLGDNQLQRAITVLKSRASANDPGIRPFTITPAGLTLSR